MQSTAMSWQQVVQMDTMSMTEASKLTSNGYINCLWMMVQHLQTMDIMSMVSSMNNGSILTNNGHNIHEWWFSTNKLTQCLWMLVKYYQMDIMSMNDGSALLIGHTVYE